MIKKFFLGIFAFVLVIFLFPFAGFSFILGFLYRISEQCFLIGYDCIANTYLKDLNKEIQEIDSLEFNYDNKEEENN